MARTPKNIRQIGGREDRIKMYMEDYVSTYLHRVQEMQEEVGMAGFLVGTWQQGNTETDDPQKKGIDQGMKQQSTVAEPACVFVSGAMMIHQANLEGGRVYLSQEAWTEGYESLGTYFSGQELCGLFVCEGSCRRFRRQALFAAVRECFPDQEALLYILTEEGEEIVYRIRERSEERLQGYYCYFERNEAMQDYMMDHLPDRRVEWEMPSSHRQRERRMTGGEVSQRSGEASTSKEWNELSYRPQNMRGKEGSLGDPAENFREKMRRQQESKAQQKSGRGIVALCAAMAVVIFVSGLGLAYRERGGVQIKDLLEQLKIDPNLLSAVSALPQQTGEHYVGREDPSDSSIVSGTSQGEGSSVIVEEIPGNVHPTEEETTAEPALPETTATPAPEETTAAPEPPETTEPQTTEPETTEPESTEPQTTEPAETEESLPVLTGVIYKVQAGDSLYSISRRFYGTDDMASVIQELNDLENADLIKEGQELLLP